MAALDAEIANRNGIVVPELMLNVEVPLLGLRIPEIVREDEQAWCAVDRRNGRQKVWIGNGDRG
jgi:hypothetical protein